MIILDTNVHAALTRTVPEALAVARLDRQAAESVWITIITLFDGHSAWRRCRQAGGVKRWKRRLRAC
jgi:predicted nucleic acid-binding protein